MDMDNLTFRCRECGARCIHVGDLYCGECGAPVNGKRTCPQCSREEWIAWLSDHEFACAYCGEHVHVERYVA